MRTEQWIEDELERIRAQGLDRHLRVFPAVGGKLREEDGAVLNFSSNDYLDLSRNPRVMEEAARCLAEYGAGAAASRLMTGTLPCHEALEQQLAALKGYPATLLFGSGWLANAGAIATVADRTVRVFADRLVHASIIDAVLLARARLFRFRHNDAEHLKGLLDKSSGRDRRLIVTESVFSMDGDLAPLKDIATVAEDAGAMLMVDEAHATGIQGPYGSGRVRELGLESHVNISMGTLSKAMGSYGGFVASSEMLRDLLIDKARAFIYTTASPPAVVGAALGALKEMREHPHMGRTLLDNAGFFRQQLQALGLSTGNSQSQIVPVVVGDAARTLHLSRRLMERGILAVAIRPPTVPAGSSRLRLSVTLAHSRDDLARAAAVIADCARQEGVL